MRLSPTCRLVVLMFLVACVAASATSVGPPAPTLSTAPTFRSVLPGCVVEGILPQGWNQSDLTTPNKIVLVGPNGEQLSITLLPAARSLDAAKLDNLCKEKLAEHSRSLSPGSRVANGVNNGVYYSARTVTGTADKAFAVAVAGNNVAGLLLSLEVPRASLAAIESPFKNIVESLKIVSR